MNTFMKRAAAIPTGATGVYRSDCPTSPPMFKDGETITVVKKGPVGHCIVRNAAGLDEVTPKHHALCSR